MEPKKLGMIIAGSAIILIALLATIKIDIDEQATFLCEATAADPNLDMEDCPAHKSSTSWVLMLIFGIEIAILGYGLYLMIPKGKVIKIDTSKLDEEERKIYELLKQHGSMYQSDLIKETEFSKVQMTRVLDKMEHKKLIDRKRRGMTNIVVLRN